MTPPVRRSVFQSASASLGPVHKVQTTRWSTRGWRSDSNDNYYVMLILFLYIIYIYINILIIIILRLCLFLYNTFIHVYLFTTASTDLSEFIFFVYKNCINLYGVCTFLCSKIPPPQKKIKNCSTGTQRSHNVR